MAGINYSLKTVMPSPSGLNSSSSACSPAAPGLWAFAVIAVLLQPVNTLNIFVKVAKAKGAVPVA
ncbi:hypothetical protein AB7386_15470 [Providencia rettgeri]